jgi:hypothetical protein
MQVHSWEEAFAWSEHPVTWWCNVEPKKMLYEELAKRDYQRFARWNDVAKMILPQVEELIDAAILPCLKGRVLPEKAKGWIQSQMVGALLERYYSDCEIQLFGAQMTYYLEGRFPCGWHVNAPQDFPGAAKVICY